MTNTLDRTAAFRLAGGFLASVLVCAALMAGGCGGEFVSPLGHTTTSQEDVARTAFEALRANDPEAMVSLYPTAEDMRWFFERMRGVVGEDEYQEGMQGIEKRGGFEAVLAEVHAECRRDFRRASEESLQALDWRSARYLGLDAERTEEKEDDGVLTADIYFKVEADGKQWLFKLDDCAETNRGWVTGDGLRFKGEYSPAER